MPFAFGSQTMPYDILQSLNFATSTIVVMLGNLSFPKIIPKVSTIRPRFDSVQAFVIFVIDLFHISFHVTKNVVVIPLPFT